MTGKPPIHRSPARSGAAALALLALAALAGCHTSGVSTAGLEVPLLAKNASNSTVSVRLEILDRDVVSTLFDSTYDLTPGGSAQIESVRLAEGPYTIRASTAALSREIDVDLSPDANYYRFVIYDDVIAYQSG